MGQSFLFCLFHTFKCMAVLFSHLRACGVSWQQSPGRTMLLGRSPLPGHHLLPYYLSSSPEGPTPQSQSSSHPVSEGRAVL